MKLQAYVVLQAEALGFKGIKTFTDPNFTTTMAVFPTKEDARNYLARVLQGIDHEQGIGWRTNDNLDPKKKLDFLITECTLEFDDSQLRHRSWKLP